MTVLNIQTAAAKTQAEQGFLDHYRQRFSQQPGAGAWERGIRDQAIGAFARQGLPHRRVEEWKYTDLRALIAEALPPPQGPVSLTREEFTAALGMLDGVKANRIVFVNGILDPALSDLDRLPQDIEFLSLRAALAAPPDWLREALAEVQPRADDIIAPLNAAFMSDGAVIRIGAGCDVEEPLHLIYLSAGEAPVSIACRNVIVVEEEARLTLCEAYLGQSPVKSQNIMVSQLFAGDGSDIRHIKLAAENEDSLHLSDWLIRLGADAGYQAVQFAAGGAVSRHQTFVRFEGEGSRLHYAGLMLLRGRQHCDITMEIDHAVPGCESRELLKAVLDGRSRGVFQGKVIVRQDAQKTDGKQMAQGLLLSETAEFDSKPELEIYADDVVCGHGSTAGQLDEDLLFYLRSRGIPEAQARGLLIMAFAAEVFDHMEDAPLREAFMAGAAKWLRHLPE